MNVVMPRLGLTMKQGKVEKWLRHDGDVVRKGEPLLEVLTEKVTAVVESPADGVLRVLVPAGQSAPVGASLATVVPAEQVASLRAPADVVASAATAGGAWVRASPAARRLARELGVDLAWVAGTGPEGRVTEEDVRVAAKQQSSRGATQLQGGVTAPGAVAVAPAPRVAPATPLARAVAAEMGVDLRGVPGSGPGGKVTREDVQPVKGGVPGDTRIPLAGRRRVIAERMAASAASAAAVTLTVHVDASHVRDLREALLPEVEARAGARLTLTDVVVKVVACALREFPYINVSLDGDCMVQHERVNVGVAVDTAEGLVVPVIAEADRRGLAEIAAVRHRLVEEARAGSISPDDLVGGTFTVTNLGMYEVEAFSPIINPPQAAILAVGRVEDRPVAVSGQVVVRPVCCLSLVFDHRLVDGGPAARFLQWVKSRLENPYLLLL